MPCPLRLPSCCPFLDDYHTTSTTTTTTILLRLHPQPSAIHLSIVRHRISTPRACLPPGGHSAVSADPTWSFPLTLNPFSLSSHPHCATEFISCNRHTRHTGTPHSSALPDWLIFLRQSHRLVVAALISTTRRWLQQIVDR